MWTAAGLRAAFRDAGFLPRKTLGQHFIVDPNFLTSIVTDAGVEKGDDVVEIGCGHGGLTEALLLAGARVMAVEIDERLVRIARGHLAERGNLTVIRGDARRISTEIAGLPRTFKVVSNLPYASTTDIMIELFSMADRIPAMTLLLQWEVRQRLRAAPGEREYGPLAVMMSAAYRARLLRPVPPTLFIPPPKVRSALVRLDRLPALPSGVLSHATASVLKLLFAHRRKKLRHAFQSHFASLASGLPRDLLERPLFRIEPRGLLTLAQQIVASP